MAFPGECGMKRLQLFASRFHARNDRLWKDILILLLGSGILAFGLYNVHAYADITEGGILGLTLLLEHWFCVSPAVSGLVLNLLCYGAGALVFGWRFIGYSIVSGAGFSVFYAVFEQFSPVWPSLAEMPFLAAVLGAVFVGVGAGLGVRLGCASGGDDALALVLNKYTGLPIQWIYLITDGIVLGLSITYLPLEKLLWSLLTVVLSGQIVGFVQRFPFPKKKSTPADV